jgi:hypothetical protein
MLWKKLLGAGGLVGGGGGGGITLSGYANEVSNSSPLDISGITINSGDIIIYWQAKDTASTPGPPSVAGYTEIWSRIGGTGGSSPNIAEYRAADGTETSIPYTDYSTDSGVIAAVFTGATFTRSTNEQNGSGSSATPTAVTVTAGDVCVVVCFIDDDIATLTAPTGYTLVHTFTVGSSGSGGSFGMAYKAITSTGTETPGAFGGTYNDRWVAGSIVIS